MASSVDVKLSPPSTVWPTSILSVAVAVECSLLKETIPLWHFVAGVILGGYFYAHYTIIFHEFSYSVHLGCTPATVSTALIYSTGSYRKPSCGFIVICQTFCIHHTHNDTKACAATFIPTLFIKLVREKCIQKLHSTWAGPLFVQFQHFTTRPM